MRDFLYEKLNKNPVVDETNKLINETIDNFIDYDYLYYVFPILSKVELSSNADYFTANKISINMSLELNSDELKTISYLASFFKEKIRYNPKEIIRYLKILGYSPNEDDIVIGCLQKDSEYNDNIENYIEFEDYLLLPDYETALNKITTKTYKHYNGFDVGFDVLVMR